MNDTQELASLSVPTYILIVFPLLPWSVDVLLLLKIFLLINLPKFYYFMNAFNFRVASGK